MSAEPVYYSVADYLALEESSEFRHEFVDGEIVMMAGESYAHNVIVVNLAAELRGQLRGRSCRPLAESLRVKSVETGAYFYPDVAVVCGEPVFSGDRPDTLVNPVVVMEVLSPSTQLYDRTVKFQHYRRIATLQQYVLVSQDRYYVEHFTRQPNGWVYDDVSGLDGVLALLAIDCRLSLGEIYDQVAMTPPASPKRLEES